MTQPRIRWSLPNLKLARAAATSSSFVALALRELFFEVAFPGIYKATEGGQHPVSLLFKFRAAARRAHSLPVTAAAVAASESERGTEAAAPTSPH